MSVDYEMVECTMEEVAERLSFQEGRKVTVAECRKIECHALRKIRSMLQERGIELHDIIPELVADGFQGKWPACSCRLISG